MMGKIDFRNFSIRQLESYDSEVRVRQTTPDLINKYKDLMLDIGDHLDMELTKGSENIYLDFTAYYETNKGFDEYRIRMFSKDNHGKLKELAINMILQS